MCEKNDTMPLGSLTIGEFKELIREILAEMETKGIMLPRSDRRVVHGLKGIENLFGVSHVTAQRYKDTIIREAVSQNGRKIVTDVDYALELFKERKGADNG